MAEEMTEDERYYITNEILRTKLDDGGGSEGDEIWTYPAIHIFRGRIPEDILKDMIEYCTETNNNLASDKLIANMEGTQSNLDPDDPLMKGFVEMMAKSACTFVNQCHMSYGKPQSPKRIEVQEIWDVKMQPGDYNPLHIHGTKSKEGLSSICYLKVPDEVLEAAQEGGKNPKYRFSHKKDGWLQFMWGLGTHVTDFDCATNSYILPKVGDYYIFSKSLNHQVFPFKTEQDRWSVQVNFNCWDDFEEDGVNLVEGKLGAQALGEQGVGELRSGMESPHGHKGLEVSKELKGGSSSFILEVSKEFKEGADNYGRKSTDVNTKLSSMHDRTQVQVQNPRGDNDTKKLFKDAPL